jgi:hypothetical protein
MGVGSCFPTEQPKNNIKVKKPITFISGFLKFYRMKKVLFVAEI